MATREKGFLYSLNDGAYSDSSFEAYRFRIDMRI
jgi:hypothetical protein